MILRSVCWLAVLAASGDLGMATTNISDPSADPRAVVVMGSARFTVLTPQLIRLEWSAKRSFEDRASLVFVNRRLPVPDFEVERTDDQLTIKTTALTLRYLADDKPFHAENLSIELTVASHPVRWHPDLENEGNLWGTYRTLDTISGGVPLEPGLLSRDGWVVVDDSNRLLFDKHPDVESGEASTAGQTDQPGSVPWGTAWPTPRPLNRGVDWYFFGHGHDYARALADFTQVAGRIPLPPRFAFGNWWSRYWAYTDRELKELVEEFDAHDVPLDVLVIDMDWHLDGWTGYTWNPKYFPDPGGFLTWVREHGLRTTLNLHPATGVKQHELAYPEVAQAMGVDPATAEHIPFDCADPRYVDAYFKYLHHPLERQGIDFWWIDWQQGERTAIEGLDPLWWLNHLHWTDMRRNPGPQERRPLLFSRWGGLGNHRYQVGFSGDTYCNWPSLAFQPYFTSTAGNVGYAYWSHDIGGHQPGPVDPELYVRWIQWGALSPILRTHTTKNPHAERRIWEFPDPIYQNARDAFRLRYALIPYIYTAARQCYDTGLPLCRPLYYAWPELREAYAHGEAYLFGDDLLVAPVAKPINPISGTAETQVWLPPGDWVNWFSGRTYAGPATIPLQVPLDEIPLFVRAGAVIPLQPKASRAESKPIDPLILHIWPGSSGRTRVYDDDGGSVAYQHTAYAWTQVSHEEVDGRRRVVISPAEGSFPEMPRQRGYELYLRDVPPPEEVTLNRVPLPQLGPDAIAGWWYDAESLSTIIRTGSHPVDQALEVAISDRQPDDLCRTGLRGQLHRLEEAIRVLPADAAVDAEDLADLRTLFASGKWSPAEMSAAIADFAMRLTEAVSESAQPPAGRRRTLLRILGLICDLRVTPTAADSTKLRLTGVVSLSPPEGVLHSASARLDLDKPMNWSIDGPATWASQKLRADHPVAIETHLQPEDLPQTTVLHTRFAFAANGLRLEIPDRQVVLPSINRWWLIGPFPVAFEKSLETVFPPEEKVDLEAVYAGDTDKPIRWRQVERPFTRWEDLRGEFLVKVNEVLERYHTNAVCYALTYLRAPQDLEATLAFGTDDAVVIWLNGQELHRHLVGRGYQSKEERIPLPLKKGTNTLMLKVSQGGGDWSFCAHVETTDGQPLPSVTAHLQP
ncbi:MAG: DUF5110 domain-containing protein [bacterium]|nr:DUF5110 domain-containing protein [bacterium]